VSALLDLLRRFSTLQWALAASVALHAGLLTLRFAAPEAFDRVFQDTPLEVILVNAKSDARPDKAQAIAQSSLAGGGEAQRGRATSPLPASAFNTQGDSYEDSQRRVAALEEQQTRLLTQIRQQLTTLPVPSEASRSNASPQQTEQEERRRQLLKLLAEIERRVNEENARPKKRYVSPATLEAVNAVYDDAMRRKIEDKGTENFPEHNGRKLYGELTMTLTIDASGRLLSTEVVQSSGNPLLDHRAEAIARAAQPFGRFNRPMRQLGDQIVVVSRFRFTRDETLETKVQSPQPAAPATSPP